MNRLWVRLTLAFGLVALIGTGTIALLTDWQAGQQVRQYLARQDTLLQSGLLDELAAFYRSHDNWQGVAEVITASSSAGRDPGKGAGRGRPPVLLADAGGEIVFDELGLRVGESLTAEERSGALAVLVDGMTAGFLVVTPAGAGETDAAAKELLDQLRSTLLVSTLLAVAVSLALGMVLGRWIAAPLGQMADGARSFSRRAWSRRIPERGSQETVEVARALNEMAASLEQAETLRRNLTADIAHELRTPITVLQGNLRAILDGVYPLESAEIASLYDQTRLLSRLVDDLRELALADSGKPLLRNELLDLAALLPSLTDGFAAAADAHAVSLEWDFPGGDLPVQADPDRLRQVINNLVINALQHTPESGCIVLSAERSPGFVTVSVSDTGEGIPAEELTRVFDRFYRADASRARGGGGTGLGLAVARAWVEAMGGRIGVESIPEKGSRFWFSLPLA
jgi:two-component system OmpR family sensor kinase/two-component system sensor histidine kinase BaeS